ncbi:glycoside hydrolase family 16 protein [Rubritalea tangerina]|uniref:Glycoside hydrolase family 16 protein n=1 Tax=Rubritalea tangerina TaxID=430798 RepID=A0ABW4ZAM3_9BACT
MTSFLSQLPLVLATLTLAQASSPWKLHWQENFSGNKVDTSTWSTVKRGKPDWKNTMSNDPRLIEVSKGTLKLKGIVNDKKNDPAPFLTAGLTSKGKFNFQYGKIQIRARFKSAQGAWPALWMLGEKGQWPNNGEIDLMEHLNFDDKVYQTLHSHFTQNTPFDKDAHPNKGSTTKIDKDAWNTYGCEWDADKVTFTVNGKPSHSYPRRPELGDSQYPFQQPFYLILSMQIGGKWVNSPDRGPSNPAHYPAHLEVDWIRVFKK